ncbi:hypothetical protein AGMMS49949_05380 [Alphaproteobacteria bacterium]|nr:hypothetical protein AGMMS49949_05380 [Alphaproteobacteria bacterium]GHS97506.1 hypothetical protein AGMMS50296_4550 [Alphaproteobacteria bacterium]
MNYEPGRRDYDEKGYLHRDLNELMEDFTIEYQTLERIKAGGFGKRRKRRPFLMYYPYTLGDTASQQQAYEY